MLKTIGHHVCEDRGNKAKILASGYPVALSEVQQKADNQGNIRMVHPFLGKGYYFWDYNIGEARRWGAEHYKNRYYIFQADINCEEDVMLDLVGNRMHMAWLFEVMDILEPYRKSNKKWKIGELIDQAIELMDTNLDYEGLFPFLSVRALDYSYISDKDTFDFDAKSDRYAMLNPRIIICVKELSSKTLTNFKLYEGK